MNRIQLNTVDTFLLAYPASMGGGIYHSHVLEGTDQTVLSTPSPEMFQCWVDALDQAKAPYVVLEDSREN